MIKKYDIGTGIPALDDSLSKLHSGNLAILVAQPDTDKTGLALSISIDAAHHKIPVAIFSMEMSNERLHERILSSLAGISIHDLQAGDIQVEQWDLISNAISQIADYPIFLGGTPNITVNDMEKAIRCINDDPEADNISLVIIDNLRLMSGDKQTPEILRKLKALAKELTLRVIAITPQTVLPDHSSTVQVADAVIHI